MATGTPAAITAQIRAICQKITTEGEPRFLTVAADPDADPGECFLNVKRKVAQEGGRIVFGWAIWEWPRVFIEAEHHAVYEAADGDWLDVTSPNVPGITQVLFLADPAVVYDFDNEGVRRDNVRFPLSDDPLITKLFGTAKEVNDIMNSIPGIGMVTVDRATADRIGALRAENQRLSYELGVKYTPQNARCFCGSGKKFKHCHGQPQRRRR